MTANALDIDEAVKNAWYGGSLSSIAGPYSDRKQTGSATPFPYCIYEHIDNDCIATTNTSKIWHGAFQFTIYHTTKELARASAALVLGVFNDASALTLPSGTGQVLQLRTTIDHCEQDDRGIWAYFVGFEYDRWQPKP